MEPPFCCKHYLQCSTELKKKHTHTFKTAKTQQMKEQQNDVTAPLKSKVC